MKYFSQNFHVYDSYALFITRYACYFLCIDLKNFLLYCTGSKEIIGNDITIVFTEEETCAISINTCTRRLTTSTMITTPLALKDELASLTVSPYPETWAFTALNSYVMFLFLMANYKDL